MMADTENEETLSTRVYVSGLPPSVTKEQLQSHFAGKFAVTDAHVVPDRHIGFVGFADHELAKSAVKYFNRSFIRMSKISVTLAKPVQIKRDAAGGAIPISERSLRRQDRQPQAQTPDSRKRKRDQRDDGDRVANAPSHPPRAPQDASNKDDSGSGSGSKEEDIHPDSHSPEPEVQGASLPEASTSDADWLRGKTSRLLDLVEDSDMPAAKAPRDANHSEAEMDPDIRHDVNGGETFEEQNVGQLPDDSARLSIPNARLFIRNLPFNTQEDELRSSFSSFGRISEVHLVKDTKKSVGKGLAYIQFVDPEHAEKALFNLDGKDFHGRIMHILPASDKKVQKLSEFELSKLPLKTQRAIKRKNEASSSSFSWNSLYMNPDAVLASVAERLGVSKAELLDPRSADAAVKQAHAETSVIKETKDYLKANGIDLGAFKNHPRDERTILVKNFAFGTTTEELSHLLGQYGVVEQLLFPTTGTMAIARFQEGSAANLAMKQLAYRNLKGSVLYLEKAPAGLWNGPTSAIATESATSEPAVSKGNIDATMGTTVKVFVRNLNFATTSARLAEAFSPLAGFLSARVKTRTDPRRPGEILSMGFGFCEFRTNSQAEAAIAAMSGRRLDGHELLAQISQKSIDQGDEQRKQDTAKKFNSQKTKIVVKNLPFEATKKDVRALLGAYGQLRSVRLPKKFDNSGRGFAFAEFVTSKEAENAIEALSSTHLLGRRLVLDFAEGEVVDPEAEIRAMEKKIQAHQDTLTHHKLTGSARRKFNVSAGEDPNPP